jgi:hypothetical protein
MNPYQHFKWSIYNTIIYNTKYKGWQEKGTPFGSKLSQTKKILTYI